MTFGGSSPSRRTIYRITMLTLLYIAANIAADVLYVPQLLRVMRDPDSAAGLSLITWAGWCFTSLVSTAYILAYSPQWPLIATFSTNLTFQILITACIVRCRFLCSRSLVARARGR